MTIPTVGAYPKEASLMRYGTKVTIRPLEEGDAHGLLQFFLRIPEEDRFFLRDEVTSPDVIGDWVHGMDRNRVLSLVALVDGQIVADATLHRRELRARRHIGEIRVVVDPRYRKQGLGSLITKELADIAYDEGLARLIFEPVEWKEDDAVKMAEGLGFTTEATLYDHIKDMGGEPHNLLVMELTLDSVPYWWGS